MILSDKNIHIFLFKYSVIILGFGISTLIGAVNTLAPLEDKIYEKYYISNAELAIHKDRGLIKSTIAIKSNDKYNIKEQLIRAKAKFKSAEHSKKLIVSVANMVESIFIFCEVLFLGVFILAIGHWVGYTNALYKKEKMANK